VPNSILNWYRSRRWKRHSECFLEDNDPKPLKGLKRIESQKKIVL